MIDSNCQKVVGWVFASVLIFVAGIAYAADAKIEKQALGQPPQDSNIIVSPAGQHVAWQGNEGSRADMVVDGVAGPPFDELLLGPSGGGIAFSKDGSRYAYFGRNGSNYSLIVDGKEMAHGAYDLSHLAFSPGGKHVYFLESDTSKGDRLVIDGKPGPWSSSGNLGVAFSPDDQHYAYNGPESENSNKWFTVIDGQKKGFVGNNLTYTADNRLISIMPSAPNGQVLMVNGWPVAKGKYMGQIYVAPKGSHYAVPVSAKGGPLVLYVDGKPVPDAIGPQKVIFTADGQHYAAICEVGNGRDFAVVDGKKGREYLAVQKPEFIPHTSRLIYIARTSRGQGFVVVDGKEFGPLGGLLTYRSSSQSGLFLSKTGGHYLFATSHDDNRQIVILDGKQVPLHGLVVDYPARISADGSRYAVAARAPKSGDVSALIVDGQQLTGFVPGLMSTDFGSNGARYAYVLFSPDSKHLVYVATQIDGSFKKGGLFVDGKLGYRGARGAPVMSFIGFTPDSKHLVWLGWVPAKRGAPLPTLFVDGKAVLPLSQNSRTFDSNMPSAWHISADGTVQFLSVADDGTVLRYRVTPPAGDGLQAMLAGAGS